MSIKPPEFTINPIFEVDKLKGIIKALKKENTDLISNLGNILIGEVELEAQSE